MNNKQSYTVGIYCRLSQDDEKRGDSNSITTQKDVLGKYVKEQNWIVSETYVDDGYSGVNFDRPAFQRMIRDIEQGKIDCVITKDLSRLGRNFVQAGFYTEVFFPKNQVRYIALNDGYDSGQGENDLAPFRHIINEWFSRDQSKKLKQAFQNKARSGRSLASHPPMGYIYSPNKDRYVIDEEYAPVIRQIFDWCIHGDGLAMIARKLYANKIWTPSYVVYHRCGAYSKIHEGKPEDKKYTWELGQIRKILSCQVYLGTLIQGTKHTVSHKDKSTTPVPESEWIVHENAHEPIISRETFELAEKKVDSRRRPTKTGEVTIFAGLIKCFDCGKTIRITNRIEKRTKVPKVLSYLQCNTYVKFGKEHCSSHYLSYPNFLQVLTTSLKECTKAIDMDEDGLIDRIMEQNNFENRAEQKQRTRELSKIKRRITELDTIFSRLYEDMVAGKVNERNYNMLANKYQIEQAELQEKESYLLSQQTENHRNEDDVKKWIALIKKYRNFTEFDRAMLNELIDVIYIHEPQKIDGTRTIQIDIHYNFVGQVA